MACPLGVLVALAEDLVWFLKLPAILTSRESDVPLASGHWACMRYTYTGRTNT